MNERNLYRARLTALGDDDLREECRCKLVLRVGLRGRDYDQASLAVEDCWAECIRRDKRSLYYEALEAVNAERRAVREGNRRATEEIKQRFARQHQREASC